MTTKVTIMEISLACAEDKNICMVLLYCCVVLLLLPLLLLLVLSSVVK